MKTTDGKIGPLKNQLVRNVLSALIVAAVGFILLILAFLLYYLIFQFFGLFIPAGMENIPRWLPILRYSIFLALIAVISWAIFRSGLNKLIKATFLTVPVAVTLVTIGMWLYPWSILTYVVGGILTLSVLIYLYRTRRPWIYYYSVILVAVTLMVFTLSGGEI